MESWPKSYCVEHKFKKGGALEPEMSLNKKISSEGCSQKDKEELEQKIQSRTTSVSWNPGYASTFHIRTSSKSFQLPKRFYSRTVKHSSFSKAQTADTSFVKPSQMESIAFSLVPPQHGICSFSLPALY